jgi:Glycosyl hydrolase family 92 N-terminal domain
MAKAVADSSSENLGGFSDEIQSLIGISQMHDSGTGGSPSLGNFPIWINNCTNSSWESCPTFYTERTGNRIGEPKATVGSFGIELDTGFFVGIFQFEAKLTVEMTSSRRANLFRITSETNIDVPIFSIGLMDLQQSTHSSFAQIQNTSRVVGNGTFNPSFGSGISPFG